MNTKSTRITYTRESKVKLIVVHGGSKISTFHPAAYNSTISTTSTTRLFCHVTRATKQAAQFGGVVNFAFIIKRILGNKRIFPCSFGNKRMRLLTRVYGIMFIAMIYLEGGAWCS